MCEGSVRGQRREGKVSKREKEQEKKEMKKGQYKKGKGEKEVMMV